MYKLAERGGGGGEVNILFSGGVPLGEAFRALGKVQGVRGGFQGVIAEVQCVRRGSRC